MYSISKLIRTISLIGKFVSVQLSLADGVINFGDKDVLGTGSYSQDPTDGATLLGLHAGEVTFGAPPTFHGYCFDPDPTDYPGTDQIFVGSNLTQGHDGYADCPNRAPGPQGITLDYSSLIPPGTQIDTITLGIAADDFQFPVFGQAFVASINGTVNAGLTSTLNSLVQTGPQVQFFSIGLDPAALDTSNVLTLTIDEGGDGGDGWAVDFLTVGVQTTAALELTSAFSRKTGKHASFDIPLPGVEDRSDNKRFVIGFTFNNNVTGTDSASTSCGTGGSLSVDPNDAHTLLVTFNGQTCNTQNVTLTLTNVHDDQGNTLASAETSVCLLIGDVNGDGRVGNGDIGNIQGHLGEITDDINFGDDINADGRINNQDVQAARAHRRESCQ